LHYHYIVTVERYTAFVFFLVFVPRMQCRVSNVDPVYLSFEQINDEWGKVALNEKVLILKMYQYI